MRRSFVIFVLLGVAAVTAVAGDHPRAETPGDGVILLKEAWEAGDLAAVVHRYAEPGASYLGSNLAAERRVEESLARVGRAVREKVGAAAEQELVPREKRATSPLVNASVTQLESKVRGDRASTRFRVARGMDERFFRFRHVLVQGDWKVVLGSIDGIPLDERAMKHLEAETAAHRKAADSLDELARDVEAGTLSGKDAIRKRIQGVLAAERRAIEADQQVERRDEGHEND